MRVLILDNDDRLRRRLQGALSCRSDDCSVDVAFSGTELLEKYASEHADIVFIRLGNTRFNGLIASHDICRLDAGAKIVFFSHSGEYAIHALRAGAAGYLMEPLDEQQLAGTLERCCPQPGKAQVYAKDECRNQYSR